MGLTMVVNQSYRLKWNLRAWVLERCGQSWLVSNLLTVFYWCFLSDWLCVLKCAIAKSPIVSRYLWFTGWSGYPSFNCLRLSYLQIIWRLIIGRTVWRLVVDRLTVGKVNETGHELESFYINNPVSILNRMNSDKPDTRCAWFTPATPNPFIERIVWILIELQMIN